MPYSLWIGNQSVPEEAAFYTLSYNSQNMVALHGELAQGGRALILQQVSPDLLRSKSVPQSVF